MAEDYRTQNAKKSEGTPFTNGLFFGILLGILVSIAITLFITSGRSPFLYKETEGACIEVNSALGDESVINIDEDISFDFYDTLPKGNTNYGNEKIQVPSTQNREVNYYLQVGAFSKDGPANNLKAKLALMGFESVIMTAKIGNNTFHRVSVGPYQNFAKAKTMRERLIQEGFKANMIKLTKPKN